MRLLSIQRERTPQLAESRLHNMARKHVPRKLRGEQQDRGSEIALKSAVQEFF